MINGSGVSSFLIFHLSFIIYNYGTYSSAYGACPLVYSRSDPLTPFFKITGSRAK
jgi:hypothetical protein